MKTLLTNDKGLTLIENMIALSLFSLVLLGAASMQTFSMKLNADARRAFCHSMAITESLEEILALPFDDPLLRDPDDGYAPDIADHGPFRIASGLATIEWEVEDGFPVPDSKRVSVTIRTAGDPDHRKAITYYYMKAKAFLD